jgi:hypothetical protein
MEEKGPVPGKEKPWWSWLNDGVDMGGEEMRWKIDEVR